MYPWRCWPSHGHLQNMEILQVSFPTRLCLWMDASQNQINSGLLSWETQCMDGWVTKRKKSQTWQTFLELVLRLRWQTYVQRLSFPSNDIYEEECGCWTRRFIDHFWSSHSFAINLIKKCRLIIFQAYYFHRRKC